MRIALVLLLLGACGPEMPDNAEVEPPAGSDEAVALVVHAWSARLGGELSMDDMVPVRWFEGPCLEYGFDDGICVKGGYAESLGADPEIHLVFDLAIHRTKLAHETLHWALDVLGLPDPGNSHEHAAWVEVADVEQELALAGH
jgi:hypothetical protein